MTPVLKSLEKKGLLNRYCSSEDERVLLVEIMSEGETLRERAVDVPYRLGDSLDMDRQDAYQLYRLLCQFPGREAK